MSIATVKRICSRVYDVGQTRVKILDFKRADEALTADDVRNLVKEKAILIESEKGTSRANARWKQSRLGAGRRRGRGSKKGTALSAKRRWIQRVRSQRKLLFALRPKFKQGAFRKVYKMVKGNAFKNKRALAAFIRESQMVT